MEDNAVPARRTHFERHFCPLNQRYVVVHMPYWSVESHREIISGNGITNH